MNGSSFGKAYFLKLEFAAAMRLALLKYFLSILMMTQKCRLLLGVLNIPFPKVIKETVRKYAAVSVFKMIKVRNDKLKSSTHLHGGTVGS